MTKKKVIRNFGREIGNFFRKKSSSRNLGPRKFFPSPQTRRQVSAADRLDHLAVLIIYKIRLDPCSRYNNVIGEFAHENENQQRKF